MAAGETPTTGSPRFQTVRRVSPTHQVREQIMAAIQRGDFPAGSPLPSERELCRDFGVSRVSVREALAGLEAMNLIVIQHGRGAFVRESVNDQYAGPFAKYLELHRDELLELLKVRGALDELAAEEVARRAEGDGIGAVERACAAFKAEAEAERPDLAEAVRLDVAFHLSIAEASKGELLPRLLTELNNVLAESREVTFSREGQLARSVTEHQAILHALQKRDPAGAREAVNKHMTGIQEWVAEFQADRS